MEENDEQRTAPFNAKEAKFLHVLSYQRSGSSVVGDLLQNMSNVFYVYEPLDGLYTAMYGTVAGWNVPSDIFVEKTGEVRYVYVTSHLPQWKYLF